MPIDIVNIPVVYIYSGVSIFLIVFLYMAYAVWRIKRMLKKEIRRSIDEEQIENY